MHLKTSSAKWWQFCPGDDELRVDIQQISHLHTPDISNGTLELKLQQQIQWIQLCTLVKNSTKAVFSQEFCTKIVKSMPIYLNIIVQMNKGRNLNSVFFFTEVWIKEQWTDYEKELK